VFRSKGHVSFMFDQERRAYFMAKIFNKPMVLICHMHQVYSIKGMDILTYWEIPDILVTDRLGMEDS